jgi:hypothetical protein
MMSEHHKAKKNLVVFKAVLGGALAVASTIARHAHAENTTDIAVEGVSAYAACGNANLDGAQEARGFHDGMLQAGSGWTEGIHYYDGNVYDTDFLDPDSSGDPRDYDMLNSDKPGAAIAFFMVHGNCSDATTRSCKTTTDCGSHGYCPGGPPASTPSACVLHISEEIITCSSGSSHNNNIYYAPGNIKWGEDAASGAWAGAGTNGDNNVVFLVNSCAGRPPYVYDQSGEFAGMQLLNIMMPTGNLARSFGYSDMIDWSLRGSNLASCALMNQNGAIRDCWAAVLDSSPANITGTGCPNLDSNFTYGGAKGFSGCGANVSIAMDSTPANALYDFNMTWLEAKTNYSNGINNYYWWAHCNYDCATYPFSK